MIIDQKFFLALNSFDHWTLPCLCVAKWPFPATVKQTLTLLASVCEVFSPIPCDGYITEPKLILESTRQIDHLSAKVVPSFYPPRIYNINPFFLKSCKDNTVVANDQETVVISMWSFFTSFSRNRLTILLKNAISSDLRSNNLEKLDLPQVRHGKIISILNKLKSLSFLR